MMLMKLYLLCGVVSCVFQLFDNIRPNSDLDIAAAARAGIPQLIYWSLGVVY